jgi:hypothetical protein
MELNKFWKTATFISSQIKDKQEKCCFTKTYRNVNYSHGNIDVVIQKDKEEFFEEYLKERFFIKSRDYKKMRYYEHNKLMCSPKTNAYIQIHLHDNVGWHDSCFISSDRLFNFVEVKMINGVPVVLPEVEMEKEILFLHAFFEKHHFSRRDLEFIGRDFLIKKLNEYNLPISFMDYIYAKSDLPLRILIRMWLKYYRTSKEVSFYNYFLHLSLFIKQKVT